MQFLSAKPSSFDPRDCKILYDGNVQVANNIEEKYLLANFALWDLSPDTDHLYLHPGDYVGIQMGNVEMANALYRYNNVHFKESFEELYDIRIYITSPELNPDNQDLNGDTGEPNGNGKMLVEVAVAKVDFVSVNYNCTQGNQIIVANILSSDAAAAGDARFSVTLINIIILNTKKP